MKTTNYLAGLAAITMTFTGVAAPISAYADDISKSASIDYATYGNFVYIIKADKTAEIVEYNGKEENVDIPAELNGYTITGISGWSGKPTNSHPLGVITGAFKNNKTIKTVVIPDTVKYIDDESFYGCTALESVMFGNGVEEIGDYAFENCTSLSKVYIPVSVKKIGAEAFGYTFGSELTLNKNFSMTCAKDSAAEKYAKENGFEYELLDHTQHTFGEWNTTKAATCTTEGTQTRTCEVCGKVETQTIKALGHKEVVDKAVAATCTKTGLTEGIHCSVCNAVIKAQETVPAKGHKYIDTVVKPTYTAKGYTLHKCSVCGESYKDTYTAKLTLAKVTGVKLGGRAADALRINWTKNTSADGYIVEMYQGENWVRVAKITDNSTTTFRKAGLAPSTVYKFRVRAYKIDGKAELYGNYSSTVTARTNPSVMTGVKIGGVANDALRVNWNKNASAQGYIIEMYQGEKWVRVAKITDNNTTTFRKAGLAKNTTYKFRVKAYYMSGKTALYGNYGSVSGKTLAK